MPTGYTHPVQTGEVADFPTFAMRCARAFGALIEMRDDPMDASIPDEFTPSPFYAERLKEAEARLVELRQMTPDEIRAAWSEAVDEAVRHRDEYRERKATERRRYMAMLAKVEAWEPPTDEHVGLKEFMVKQLWDSIKLDCGDWLPSVDLGTPDEWWRGQVAAAERDIARYRKELAAEKERAEARTRWVRQLRASLAEPAVHP